MTTDQENADVKTEVRPNWDPKVGDVVALNSQPDHPMTVVSYNKDKQLYDLCWIAQGGGPVGFAVVRQALQKFGGVQDEVAMLMKNPRVQKLTQDYSLALQQLEQATAGATGLGRELAESKRATGEAIAVVRGLLPELPSDAVLLEAVLKLRAHAETVQREGNEVIKRLQAQIPTA